MKRILSVLTLAVCAIFMVSNASAQGTYDQATMGAKVVEMETASWGQNKPYNDLCPTVGTTPTKTGCGPTAFAILCHYYKWPVSGSGSVTHNSETLDLSTHYYDYENMLLSYSGSYNDDQATAVATLMRDLGYATKVGYGTSATTFSENIKALKANFSFTNSIFNPTGTGMDVLYRSDAGDESFKRQLKECLSQGYPILFTSLVDDNNPNTTDGRHIFILDGYTENEFFHFNFGWNGYGNGWYTLDNVRPDEESDYSTQQRAYLYVIPNRTPRAVTASVSPTGAGAVTVNGNANSAEVIENTYATLVATANNGYTFSHWSKGGAQVSTEKTYKALVAAEGNEYVANFLTVGNTRVNVSVSYNSSYGTVTYNSSAVSGTGITPYQNSEVTLVATPLDGYVFNGWTVIKGTNSTPHSGTELTFVATEDMRVEANFSTAEVDYSVTASTLTKSGNEQESSSYCSTYTFNGGVAFKLTTTIDDVEAYALTTSDQNIDFYATAHTKNVSDAYPTNIKYTLSAPEGYLIKMYSFDLKSSTGTYSINVNYGNNNNVTIDNSGYKTISETNIGKQSVSFILSTDYNRGRAKAYVDNFSITLEKISAEGGEGTVDPTTKTYTINVSTNPGTAGTVKINDEAVSYKSVNENSTVTLVATPLPGYSFVNWTDANNGSEVSDKATYSYTATSDKILVANFEQTRYTVTVEAGEGGSAYIGTKGTTEKTVSYNGNVTITAEAASGYRFVKWTDSEGNDFSNLQSVPVSVTTNATYTAVFEPVLPITGTEVNATFAGATGFVNQGYTNQVVLPATQTAPAITFSANVAKIGHSTVDGTKYPYLFKGTNFTISVPAPYKIAGYKLTVQGHEFNAGTFTYTVGTQNAAAAMRTAASARSNTATATISGTTPLSVVATGLNTSEINIGVGNAIAATAGIIVKELQLDLVQEAQESEPVYTRSDIRITSNQLMSITKPTHIAVKNLSKTNNWYFAGTTNVEEFGNEAVFVWTPKTEGVAGEYYLKTLDGKYLGAAGNSDDTPISYTEDVANAAVFTTLKPVAGSTGTSKLDKDSDTDSYVDNYDLLVRFMTKYSGGTGDVTTRINVTNTTNPNHPKYYSGGYGMYTAHNVYAVSVDGVAPEIPEEQLPTDPFAGKYFRLKDKGTGKYMNVADNNTHATGAYGGVSVATLNESSNAQIFFFEANGDGYKLQDKNGYYIKGQEWNIDANSKNAEDGSVLLFEETTTVNEYYIKWNNTTKGGIRYFKVGLAQYTSNYYPYGDEANKASAAVWVLEEVVYYTVTATAGEGGSVSPLTSTIEKGKNVTLTATADSDHRFVGWYNGDTKVSEENPYTFAVTSNINYEARFGEPFPDGAYKIHWQADNRGYLAYHGTDYPNEAKLAGVTYTDCQNIHYAVDQVDLVWYLITASDGKRYLFQAATGKFLGANPSIDQNGIANKLSTTEAWPINVEKNTHSTRLGHYIITTEINGTKNLLCSGCGTPKEQHPVRWLIVNDANQKDGGAPLQLIPVNDVNVAENVMNAVRAVIEPRTFKFKAEIENWRDNNPNTHLGTITIGGTAMKLTPEHRTASELTMPLAAGTTLAFTRKYRGFEFNGFYIGETSLGTNLTLTADNVAAINETTPLVAKFTATDDVTLFYDDDTYSYRIPAIAKTGTNRLVAVSDYRHSLDDIGRDQHHTGTNRVDLVMRTSDDNGATWSAKQTIAEGTSTFGYGDAAIVANGQDILVMAVAGNVFYPTATATSNNKTYRIYSNNNGQSWTKEEVTSNIFGLFDEAYATFFGSGKLAVDPDFNGTGKARVYGAILLKNSARSTNNYVLFSDDWGANWKILGGSKTQIAEADEPKVEILPNGQILLSSRHASGGSRVFNVFTYGNDKAAGEGTWGTAVSGCSNGGSNGTNGEIICLDAKRTNGKPTKILLQSQPKGGSNTWDRKDVTIWYKELNEDTYTPSSFASGWNEGLQVSTVQSAYSAMALQENGEIAFFFEEAPCYGDDNTKGYSMVYVPLTIEEATGGAFLNPNADVEYVPVEFNIVLTDAQGNEYRETLDEIPGDGDVAAVASYLTNKYPFIKLGTTGAIAENKYTNTVTLPFKVSNADNAYWHNIYWPANDTDPGMFFPIYLKAETKDATYITKLTEHGKRFGESQYNTYEYADKLGWAVYSVNNTLTFKFKNKLTGKYMAVNGVVSNGNADNVIFTDEAGATAFTLTKNPRTNAKCQGDYAITSVYDGTTGYVCNTSVGYANATNYTGKEHAGAWAVFGDADYDLLISNLDQGLNQFGNGNDKRMLTTEIQAIIDAMGDYNNPLYKTMLLKDLKAHFATLENAINNWPKISLTIAPVGGGTTKIAGEANVTSKYVPTGQLTVEAVPASGYSFVNWTKGTEEVSTNASYTFNMDAATELTANFEKNSGYYHLINRDTNRDGHLYNNAFSSGNTYGYTLQSESKVETNNGIWHITKNGNQWNIKNGDGKPVVAGMNHNAGVMGSYSELTIEGNPIKVNDGYTYYYFSQALNCSNHTDLQVGGINYLTIWSGYPNEPDNHWRLERVDTDGKHIYDVVVECTEQDVYVTYGSEYAFNGGFFITNEAITAQQLTAKKDNAEAQGVEISVEGNTIKVVDIKVEIAVSATSGGTVTINGESASTLQVVKSSNVTVKATPANGYRFVNWTNANGEVVSTEATYTFTASESTSLVANFETDVVYHKITVSTYYNNNGGTVKVGKEDATSVDVAEGGSVEMLATVANGYEFMGWLKDGILVKNAIDNSMELEIQGPNYTLYNITAPAEYVAVFSKITETSSLEDGKAYRICGVQGNGRARCIYRDGNTLKWKDEFDNNDVNTIFVAQKNGNGVSLISAVGYHGWKANNMLGNDEQYNPYAAIKVTYGTRDELRTLYIESGTSSGLFQTNADGAFSFQNSRGRGLTMTATDETTTDFLFQEVDTYAFQVSAADGSNAKLGTVNLPFATTVPDGVKVYGIYDSNETHVYVEQLELTNNVLPANTPVLIEAEASGKYGFKPAPASANVHETGFAGTLGAEAIPGTTNAYILSYNGAGTAIKLYKLSSTSAERTINANKAYYIDATGKASALQFVFGGTTDIEEVKGENGEVEAIYDLQGRKLSEITEPGIYIINGKKVYKK